MKTSALPTIMASSGLAVPTLCRNYKQPGGQADASCYLQGLEPLESIDCLGHCQPPKPEAS